MATPSPSSGSSCCCVTRRTPVTTRNSGRKSCPSVCHGPPSGRTASSRIVGTPSSIPNATLASSPGSPAQVTVSLSALTSARSPSCASYPARSQTSRSDCPQALSVRIGKQSKQQTLATRTVLTPRPLRSLSVLCDPGPLLFILQPHSLAPKPQSPDSPPAWPGTAPLDSAPPSSGPPVGRAPRLTRR